MTSRFPEVPNEYFDCSHCGTHIYRNSPGQIRDAVTHNHHNPGGDACVRTLKKRIASLEESLIPFLGKADPRCAKLQEKGEGGHVTSCECKKPVLVSIEREHVEGLHTIARRVESARQEGVALGENEARAITTELMSFVRHAEVLEVLRGPGQPQVHVCPAMDKDAKIPVEDYFEQRKHLEQQQVRLDAEVDILRRRCSHKRRDGTGAAVGVPVSGESQCTWCQQVFD